VPRDDVALADGHYIPPQFHRDPLPWPTSMNRLLGLLARILGNLDKATERFEEALAFCPRLGYGPELAWTCRWTTWKSRYRYQQISPPGTSGRPSRPVH
jgi:hypothetical protein